MFTVSATIAFQKPTYRLIPENNGQQMASANQPRADGANDNAETRKKKIFEIVNHSTRCTSPRSRTKRSGCNWPGYLPMDRQASQISTALFRPAADHLVAAGILLTETSWESQLICAPPFALESQRAENASFELAHSRGQKSGYRMLWRAAPPNP